MNWVDIAIISLIGFSALLASVRGLVREVLGIGSWLAAGLIAAWTFPYLRADVRRMIGQGDVADVAGFGAIFLVALLVLSVISGVIGGLVRASVLNGIDRTFGVVFGLVRGAVVVAFAYIVAGMLEPIDNWPTPVQEARTLPYVYEGAMLVVSLLPQEYRPVVHIPPGGRPMKAAEFLRVNPQGRAIARP